MADRDAEPRAARVWARLPAPLRDPGQRPALLGWLGAGLAVRFLLMPFGVSADLLAVYWRASRIAHHGEVFADHLVNMGAHYVHALALVVLSPFLPAADQVWTEPWFFDDFIALAAQVVATFTAAEHAHQTLFVLKIPYLLADLGAGLALLALAGGAAPRRIRLAWAFWMLSPIGLYASYAFGRYEMLAVVLVVSALLAVERGRIWWGAVLLGLAVTMRTYPLILIPAFALVAGGIDARGGWRLVGRQAVWAVAALTPFALVMATNRLVAGTVGELARLQEIGPGQALTALAVDLGAPGAVYGFVLFALLITGVLAGRTWGWWGTGPIPVSELWIWLYCLHVGLFGLTHFSAHYLAWLTPFIALALARRASWRGVLPLHLVQAAVVLAFTDLVDGPDILLGTLRSAFPADLALPSLRAALLANATLAEQVAGVLRTTWTAVAALLAWPALRELASAAPRVREPA
jgi:hypothetical protein